MTNAKPLPVVLEVVSLPDDLSMKALASSSLPGHEYAQLACDAQRIPTQMVFMVKAVEAYAIAKGYDAKDARRSFMYAQMGALCRSGVTQ